MAAMETRRMCPNCRAFISTKDKECAYCGVKLGPRAIDRRSPSDVLGGLIPHARFTTVVILTINFGLYLAMAVYSMKGGNQNAFMSLDGRTLFDFGAKLREAIFGYGQWWRLITAGFLHAGLLHILMNSWVLFDLGTTVEQFYGTSRMLAIYFVSTITGFLASSYWNAGLSVGASAPLFGLIGAMIALGVTQRSSMGSAIKAMYTRWALYGLVFGLMFSGIIDNAAHLGGLAGGFATAYLANTPKLVSDWKDRFWRYASIGCIALTVLAFFEVFLTLNAKVT
ncbi:MAG: rhomboid family intramembrane serine protease [Bryobacteraceae bacterium]|nr:rhomboid family intramembrane serine protease [Bryobacteraceae bacterium]